MAQLKDLLVTGPARFLTQIKANVEGDLTGNADTATKATQDASGNIIISTYATKTELENEADAREAADATKVNRAGDTMGGELVFNGGDAAGASKIVFTPGKGQITNTGTSTLFGFTSNTDLAVGHSSYTLKMRGSATHPTYNNSNLAVSNQANTFSGATTFGANATFSTGSTQATTPALKWGAINSKNPFFGYATDQTDGTFLWSITGTNYQSGLAIGGGTGNLIWKGNRVLDTADVTGAVSTILTSNLTANRALISNGSGKVAVSGITSTELNSLDNIEGNIHRERVSMVPRGTAVSANANLNTTTYLKVGNYYCSETNTAKTLANCPVSNAFMMQVYSPLSTTYDNETTGAWVYRLRVIQDYTGPQYVQRCSVNGTANVWTYGPWEKVVKAQNNEIQHSLGIKGSLTAESLELNGSTPYIDFHFGKSTADYTSRIIEDASGELNFAGGSKTKFNTQAWFFKNPVIEKSTTIADNEPARLTLQTVQTNNGTTTSSTISVYDDHDTDGYGNNMVIKAGGNMILGGGESAENYYNTNLKDSTSEHTYITADGTVYLVPNCNTIANAKIVTVNTDGTITTTGANRSEAHVRNSEVRTSSTTGTLQSTGKIIYIRE